MAGHHLVLGKLVDFIKGVTLEDTHDERYRQKIARILVAEKGFEKTDIDPRLKLRVAAGDKRAVVIIDFVVKPVDPICMIIKYGPGSIVTSPVTVSGIADPTFEQTLVVRILLTDNTVLALEPTIIQADLGERGRYSVDVPFQVESTTQGFIQVFAESARDGGITHLSTMGVALAPSGPETIVPGQFLPEQIWIQSPVLGQTVSGGVVRVQGFALASFEQTLVIDVYDASGNLVGSKPTMTHAPDLGLPGPFDDTVSYIVGSTGPGRIVVRDPSVAFVGDYHIASVEITLEP